MILSSGSSQIARSVRDAVTALENAEDVYSNLDDAADLPQAFHEVAKAISTATQSLETVKQYLSKKTQAPAAEKEVDKIAGKKQKEAAERFQARASKLCDIFDAVIPPGDGPRAARYRSAAGKGGRVELLMKELLEAIIQLAQPPVISEGQAAELEDVLQQISKIPPSLEDEPSHSFHNYGSGPQSVHLGTGDQNINTGSGMQFNGKFMAPFHLPKS